MSVPAAYMGIVIIWSTTPLAIHWSLDGVGFLFGVAMRMTVAMLVCASLVKLLRIDFPWDKNARWTYLISGVGLYGAMISVYWGAQYVSTGLLSVLNGFLPMATAIVAALWFKESLWQPGKIIGVLLGVTGLMVIFNPSMGIEAATIWGAIAVLVSVLFHAVSMLGVKLKGSHVPALSATTGGLFVAVPLYGITWVLSGAQWPEVISERNVIAIGYLAVIGSSLGFVLFYYTLKKTSADAVALITLITPVCALLIGHFYNGEALEAQVLWGAAFILLGLSTHQWGQRLLNRWALNRTS